MRLIYIAKHVTATFALPRHRIVLFAFFYHTILRIVDHEGATLLSCCRLLLYQMLIGFSAITFVQIRMLLEF